MVELACPRCGRLVEISPGTDPTCPQCGFQGARTPSQGPGHPYGWGSPSPSYHPGGLGFPATGGHVRPFGGFWIRVVAALIDGLVVAVPYFLLLTILLPDMAARAFDPDAPVDPLETVLSLVIGWLYSALLESSRHQATVGKMAVGLKVTDIAGRRISFARATGRHFASFLSALILLIGFFMIGWTRYKQGLHDKIAGTLVYKKDFAPPPDRMSPPPY